MLQILGFKALNPKSERNPNEPINDHPPRFWVSGFGLPLAFGIRVSDLTTPSLY